MSNVTVRVASQICVFGPKKDFFGLFSDQNKGGGGEKREVN